MKPGARGTSLENHRGRWWKDTRRWLELPLDGRSLRRLALARSSIPRGRLLAAVLMVGSAIVQAIAWGTEFSSEEIQGNWLFLGGPSLFYPTGFLPGIIGTFLLIVSLVSIKKTWISIDEETITLGERRIFITRKKTWRLDDVSVLQVKLGMNRAWLAWTVPLGVMSFFLLEDGFAFLANPFAFGLGISTGMAYVLQAAVDIACYVLLVTSTRLCVKLKLRNGGFAMLRAWLGRGWKSTDLVDLTSTALEASAARGAGATFNVETRAKAGGGSKDKGATWARQETHPEDKMGHGNRGKASEKGFGRFLLWFDSGPGPIARIAGSLALAALFLVVSGISSALHFYAGTPLRVALYCGALVLLARATRHRHPAPGLDGWDVTVRVTIMSLVIAQWISIGILNGNGIISPEMIATDFIVGGILLLACISRVIPRFITRKDLGIHGRASTGN